MLLHLMRTSSERGKLQYSYSVDVNIQALVVWLKVTLTWVFCSRVQIPPALYVAKRVYV